MENKPKVLMVCLGNICRSPMAEAVLKSMVDWYVDSAALESWNIGRQPEKRCLQVLADNNLTLKHKARIITQKDFNEFDYIFGMDHDNMTELNDMAPKGCRAKVELLGTYDYNETDIIKDPYYESGLGEFRKNFEQITRSCKNFVATKQ